ncbi:MAG: BamA/TamA family outer membrane protein [Pseudomonadota bacterium]
MKRLLLFLLILSVPSAGWANGPLRSIVIFGNEKTERQTVLEIIGVPPQTFVNEQLLRDVDDRLAHSGLFKQIRVRKVDNRDGTTDLRILVIEKQLWFVFPIFQAWSGRYSGGAAFAETNLFWPGTSTLFVAQGGNKLNRFVLGVDARNLWDSNFTIKSYVLVRSDEVFLFNGSTQAGNIRMKDVGFSVTPGYQWTNEIQTALGINYSRVWYGDPTLGTTGNDVSLQFSFIYDSLRRREALLKGWKLVASTQFSESRIGSDFLYHVEEVSFTNALTLFKYFNYVVDLEGKIGDGPLPFHREFTLGGSSLRGYEDREFRGDTQILARQNLLFRMFRQTHFSVFGLAFHDLGLLYHDAQGAQGTQGISRNDLHNGIGGGLRVSLADIIAPVMGVDAGYGIEDHAFRLYFALGLVEF